jgi:phosphate/sulfate permease
MNTILLILSLCAIIAVGCSRKWWNIIKTYTKDQKIFHITPCVYLSAQEDEIFVFIAWLDIAMVISIDVSQEEE